MIGELVKVILRLATEGDCERIFSWRNDPSILMRGASQTSVTWEEHSRWFQQTLADANRRVIYIIESQGCPAGVIRFDSPLHGCAVVSVYLTAAYLGQGLGVAAIRQGCSQIQDIWKIRTVVANVLETNPGAIKAFVNAGFVADEDTQRTGLKRLSWST